MAGGVYRIDSRPARFVFWQNKIVDGKVTLRYVNEKKGKKNMAI